MSKQTQGSRSMVVAVKVTPSEKHRIEWVAGARGTDVSNLLRQMSVDEILKEQARLSARLLAVGA